MQGSVKSEKMSKQRACSVKGCMCYDYGDNSSCVIRRTDKKRQKRDKYSAPRKLKESTYVFS